MPRVSLTPSLRRWSFALLAALALSAGSGRARAESETADEAELQFQLGNDRYDAGDVRGALEHFLVSNRLAPNKNVLFDIARCYEQLKQLPDAYRYYSASLDAETSEAGRRRILESMERLKPKVALLSIESDPPGAVIYLDRKDLGSRGVTPRTLALPEGAHTLLLELPNFEPARSERVELRLGEEAHAQLRLRPVVGQIQISGTPQTIARVDTRERTQCQVPCSLSVQVGKHVVSLSRAGYRTQEVPVEVAPRQTVKVRANLEPLSGSAVVSSDVAGALVSIDGQPRAFTPAVINLPVGKHEVVVAPTGYRPLRRTVLIETDRSTRVSFEMSGQEEVLGASRSAEAAEDAPASVTIISRQELRAMAYPTIAEAIRGVRGMYLSYDDVYTSSGVRGFSRPGDYGNRILVLLDGHPTNDNWVGSSYMGFDARVDIDDVERIEVVRGAGSVVYGNGAFFGVINLVTRGRQEDTHAELSVGTALGAGRARATGVVRASQDAGLWFSIAGAKAAGLDRYYPEYVSTPGEDGAPSITDYRGAPATGVVRDADGFEAATFGGRAWYKSLSASWFLTVHDKHSPSAQYRTNFGDPRAQNRDTRSFVDVQLEPKWQHVESLTRLHFDAYRYTGTLPYPTNDQDPESFGPEIDRFSGLWGGAEQRLVFKPNDALRLTVGGDLTRHFQTKQRATDGRDSGGYMGPDAGPILDTNNPYTNIAGYALLDAVASKSFRASLGARLDYFTNLKFDAGAALSPRLAVIIKPYTHGNLKLLAGKAFRAPSQLERYYLSTTQLAASDVRPEQVYSGEAELTHRFTSAVSGLVTAYGNYVKDLIELSTVTVDGVEANQETNSNAPILVLGGEAELRHEWQQGFMLAASTSVQKARYLNDDNRREVPNSPTVLGSVRAVVPLVGRALNLATRLSVEGPRYDNALRKRDVSCDDAGAKAVACPGQGTTRPGVIWDLVFTGGVDRFNASYAVGLYNAMDWSYDTVPSTEYLQRTIRQRPRSVLASLSLKF